MLNNYNFVKKNDNEIFRQKCSEVSQMLDKVIEKLTQIRRIVYQCDFQQEKPLIDSQYENDVQFIKKIIKKCCAHEQQQIFQQTIITMDIYKCEFDQICQIIQKKLKQMTFGLMRNYSTNLKIFENLNQKKDLLNNYFNSLEDSDSPCKVRAEVFDF